MSSAEESIALAPRLAVPSRPARPLSTWGLFRVGLKNTLATCDDELFEELFVARRFVWGRLFIVSDPEGIKRVLQDNVDNYPRVDAIRRVFEFGSGTGMLSAEGETWRRHRLTLNPTLDHRAVVGETPKLIALAQQFADHLAAVPTGVAINVGEAFTHLLTRTTGQVFAGDDPAIDEMVQHMGHYPGRYGFLDWIPLPGWMRFVDRYRKSRREARELHPLLERLIEARRDERYAGERDLLWRLSQARHRQTGDVLPVAEIEDEALTLGSTSVTSLQVYSWLWYLLAAHPWAEAKLHSELETVLRGRVPSPADLPQLVYLRRLVDETMRLYPPLPIMIRRAAADDTVCGRPIPRRSYVAVMPWVVHRHRKLWPDPDRFDPDRFTPGQVAARSRYAYLPFSVGPHICIGMALAIAEILATMAVLAQRFRFRLAPGTRVEPVAWTSLRPGSGLMMTVEPRAHAE